MKRLILKRLILKYGLLLFIILVAFKYLEYQFFSNKLSLEIYIIIVSTIFLFVGFMFAKYWLFKERVDTESRNDDTKKSLNYQKLSEFSKREQDVLQLLCHGYANKEIAQSLNVSINTVKTHVSKVFSKLDVHNRTEALMEAKLLNIIN